MASKKVKSMKRWDTEEITLLRIMCEAGWLYRDIANELDRTETAITKKCSSLKITNNLMCRAKTQDEYEKKLNNTSLVVLENYINSTTAILHKCIKCNAEYYRLPLIPNLIQKHLFTIGKK